MTLRLRLLRARILPHGWGDVLRQILLFGGAYVAYRIVRGLVEGRANAAFAHARDVISFERTLHFFVEPSIQAWASGSHLVMVVASWLYVNAQTSVTLAALVFLYLFHNRSFYFVRNMLLIGMAISLVAYMVFPTAPPRFLPEWGFIDTVSDFTGVKVETAHGGGGAATTLTNLYAAVPSMHVAFALMIAWPLASLARWRWVRFAWRLYPLVITFVIVVTANHFIFDAVLGAMTAAVSAYGALWLARVRPHAWRFSPAASRATATPGLAGAAATVGVGVGG